MKFFYRLALALTALAAIAGCQEQVPLVCPAMPEVRFTPSPSKIYSVKDNLLVNIEAYATEGSESFLCPSTVCFTLDGSTPSEGRASTQCLPAPVKKIPVNKPVCIKYFVKGVDGSESTVKQACYQLEEAPRSACTPESKASGEPLTVTLESTKDGTIFYTTDGTDPDPSGESPDTESGKAPVNLKIDAQGTTTVRFRAQDVHGNLEPGINTCDYTYDSVPPTTVAAPAGSASNDPIQVSLATNEPARIYYTLDGSTPEKTRLYSAQDPAAGSTIVAFQTAQITIDESKFLRFYAEDIPVGNAETPIHEEVYFIGGKPAVKVEPGTGRFVETNITVTLTGKAAISANQAALKMYYTLDGSDPTCAGAGEEYGAPITDMNKEGDYTLRYIACDGPRESGIKEATFTLGATGNPFYPELKFTSTANIDLASTSKSIEVSTRDGFRYAKLRRKIPVQIGTGIDGVSQGVGFGLPLQYNLPQALAVTTAVNTAYVHYVTGRQISVYGVDTNSVAQFGNLTFIFPETSVFEPCSQSSANGIPLGIKLFQDNSGISGVVPWTTATNCGGYAKFAFGNYSAKPTHPFIRANNPQFANTQDDPPVVDVEEAGDEVFVNLPKSDVEVAGGFSEDIAFVPTRSNGFGVEGFFMSTGNLAITAPTTPLSDRAISLDLNADESLLAVGDQAGNIYVYNSSNLTPVGSAVTPVCDAGRRCRINDLTWYETGGRGFILAAVGAYGDTDSGKLAIAELNGSTLSLITSSALDSDTDPYQVNGVVESVQVLPNSDYALLSLRQHGIVVVTLDDVANGNVQSRGYANGADIGDDQFWAIESAPFLPLSLVPRAAVLDAGRTNQGIDAGFRVFEFKDVEKFETAGVLLTNDLNTVGKSISRAKLIAARYNKDGVWYDNVLPSGLTVTLIGDDVENTQPLNIGSEVAFPAQPTDVRAKLSFASPDTGATTVRIDYLQFKFTPVE